MIAGSGEDDGRLQARGWRRREGGLFLTLEVLWATKVPGMASGVERRGALRAQGNEHFRSARYKEALALYVLPPREWICVLSCQRSALSVGWDRWSQSLSWSSANNTRESVGIVKKPWLSFDAMYTVHSTGRLNWCTRDLRAPRLLLDIAGSLSRSCQVPRFPPRVLPSQLFCPHASHVGTAPIRCGSPLEP